MLGAAVLVGACSAETPVAPAPSTAPGSVTPADGPRDLAIVLPPADGLADAERARLRLLVESALEKALPPGAPVPHLLEPTGRDALADTVELAVRRVGAGGTVCVLGAGVWGRVESVFALYPATRICLLPDIGADVQAWSGPATALVAEVDLERLGRELGAAARAAAGERTVVVLDGGDAMLGRRWLAGLESASVGPRGGGVARGALQVLRTAQELLVLLDEQTELLERGVVPGSPEALAGPADAPAAMMPFRDELPLARSLPPVGVVVLDASSESAALMVPLAERGIAVIAPRSLLLAAGVPEDTVVLRWRVRWDLPLTGLVQRIVGDGSTATDREELFVLEPGPAHVVP